MDRKLISLVISASDQTGGAFHRVIGNLNLIQRKMSELALWGITAPRSMILGFGLLSSVIASSGISVGKLLSLSSLKLDSFSKKHGQVLNDLRDHQDALISKKVIPVSAAQLYRDTIRSTKDDIAETINRIRIVQRSLVGMPTSFQAAWDPFLNQLRSRIRNLRQDLSDLRSGQLMPTGAGAHFGVAITALNPLINRQQRLQHLFSVAGSAINIVGQRVAILGVALGTAINFGASLGAVLFRVFGMLGGVFTRIINIVGNVLINVFNKLKIAAIVSFGAISAAAAATIKHGVEMNAVFESAGAAFETMTRSSAVSKQLMAALQQEAVKSAFDFKELVHAAQQLLTTGTSIKDIIPTIRILGDAALIRGSEGAIERFHRLAFIFGQIRATGKLIGNDMIQLGQAGINVREILNIPAGASIGALDISSAQGIPVLLKNIEQRFGGLQDRLKNSVVFLLSALRDRWDLFTADVTNKFYEAWRRTLLNVNRFFDILEKTTGGSLVTNALRDAFGNIGGAIEFASRKLIEFIPRVAEFLNSDRWQNFVSNSINFMGRLFTFLVNGIHWFFTNWVFVWPGIVKIAEFAFKLLSGLIGGLLEVFFSLVSVRDPIQKLFDDIGNSIKILGITVITIMTRMTQGVLLHVLVWKILQATILGAIFAITKNSAILTASLVALGEAVAIAVAIPITGTIGNNIVKQIEKIDQNDIAARLKIKFDKMMASPGILGAFATGFNLAWDAAERMLSSRSSPFSTSMFQQFEKVTSELKGTSRSGGDGLTLPALQLQMQLEALKEQLETWKTLESAAREYSNTIGDQTHGTKLILTTLLGQLSVQLKIKDTASALISEQPKFSSEWFKSVQVINEAAEGILKIKEQIRDLIFDTQLLRAANDELAKIFTLGKEAGFSPEELNRVANQQFTMLTQTLMVERSRLATLTQGTLEWFKQRSTVIDIIEKMVRLKKELADVNNKLQRPMLGIPSAPFGIRGPSPEIGPIPSIGMTELGKAVRDLLHFSLNPASMSFEAVARGIGAGLPVPGAVPAGSAGAIEARRPFMHNQFSFAFGSVNDFDTVKRIVGEVVEAKVDETLKKITGWTRDRRGN